MKKILALDLGTNCGWAMQVQTASGVSRLSGAVELATAKEIHDARLKHLDRLGDPRYYRLLDVLADFDQEWSFDVVLWEDVQFSSYTMQTQLWASFRTAIWTIFRHGRKKITVDVGTLKKFATGHGAATKTMMATWLAQKHPTLFKRSALLKNDQLIRSDNTVAYDDEVDANHLLDFGIKYHS